MMQHFTTFDGLKLAYMDEGTGMPVLCLPGLTRNSADFDYLAPHLPDVRLIRLDYRGRGASDWAEDPLTYSVPVEARDVTALLDHLGLEKAAVLGTSRGGIIAMMLAATAKDRLIGVALNDVGPVIEQISLDRIMLYLGINPKFRTRADMAAAMPAGMAGFANVPMQRWLEEAERQTLETAQGLAVNYDPNLRVVFEAATQQDSPDLWPLFDAMNGLPLALIRGANSDLLSPDTAAEMRKRRPDMVFTNVPDRGHIPFLDEPEALSVIRSWVKSCQ